MNILAVILALYAYCFYKSIVKVREGQTKNVQSFLGRYVRKIVGIRGKRAATKKDVRPAIKVGDMIDDGSGTKRAALEADQKPAIRLGELIDGEDDGDWDWIWFPFQYIRKYQIRKIITVEAGNLSEEQKRSGIAWGNPETDKEVSVYSVSLSDHYREQFTYEMVFDNIETGRDTTAGVTSTAAQNIKLREKLNVTVRTKNGRDTMYQEGDGGKWLATLHSVIMSCLSELHATKTYNLVSDLRSKKLNDAPLSDGKTFMQRINEQMLDLKNLGQEVVDLDFVDYEIMPESKAFADSLSKLAVAQVNKQTAGETADAERTLLRPKIEAQKELIGAARDAQKALYGTRNVTVIEQAQALPDGLKVFAGNLYSPTQQSFDTALPKPDDIIKESLAHNIADEISSADDSTKTKKRRT